jgi:hypothetical protein
MTTAPYKLTLLLTTRTALEPADFSEQWLALEARQPLDARGLTGHVFDRPCQFAGTPVENAAPAPYDAAQETWWAHRSDAANWFVSHEFRAWLADRLPLLARAPDAVGGHPHLIWEREVGSDPVGAVKMVTLPVARRRLTVQQFASHWCDHHAKLALAWPSASELSTRMEFTPAQSTPTPFSRTRFDGAGAVTFESMQAIASVMSSDYYKDNLAPDELEFTTPNFSAAYVTSPVILR